MEPIFELAIRLPDKGSRDLLRAVHGQLKAAILDGRLRPGSRLPATRVLAGLLGVSRNTALAAYDLLLSEGYLEARRGAGTYVAVLLPEPRRTVAGSPMPVADDRLALAWRQPPVTAEAAGPSAEFDFEVGFPDQSHFPVAIWRRLSARALRALARMPAAPADPAGRAALRAAIAGHVSFTRAVACRDGDVVVTAGAQQAFDLLARVLVTPGETVVAVEEPGYPPLSAAFAAAGADIQGVPVDEEGLRVELLPEAARVICVTPSHQFPLGVTLSARRRAALLELAASRGAVVIEDDYDSEFRFGGRPLDALQTLDRSGTVCYVGTFSKSLIPALRLGFVVAPPWLRPALVAARRLADWHGPVVDQDTLAAFIAEGHLARHVRRMRRIYGQRRAALLQAMARHCAGLIEPVPASAGLHLTARLAPALNARTIAERAAAAGIALQPLTGCGGPGSDAIAFGFGKIAAERIEPAIRRLAPLLRP